MFFLFEHVNSSSYSGIECVTQGVKVRIGSRAKHIKKGRPPNLKVLDVFLTLCKELRDFVIL